MASYTISGANCTSFSGGTEMASSANVGTTWDGNYQNTVVCRYKFTTDAYGATGISFQTGNATATVRGAGDSSDNSIGRMRFDVTDSATKYKTYRGSDYGHAITQYSYGNYVKGSLSVKLRPNTTYYLWIFPAGNFAGYTRFSLGSCSLSTSGSYGTASSISASNGSFGSAIPISLSNSVSGVTHTLTVSCGGVTRTLLSGSTAMSAVWTPSLADYGPAIPNARSAQATISCATSYGGASWGSSSKTITVSFPASAGPEISAAELSCDNSGGPAAALSLYIQGCSRVRAQITAAGRWGASIADYALSVGGGTVHGASAVQTSDPLAVSGSLSVTLTVTDSRGLSASLSRSIQAEPYARPVLSGVELFRCDENGAAAEDGTCLSARAQGSVASLQGQNSMSMRVAFKSPGGSYGAETPMSSGSAVVVPGLSADRSYLARITLSDALGNETVATGAIQTQRWALKFNSGGTAAAFGKAPEADKVLEIPHDWQIVRKNADGTQTRRALFSDELLDLVYPVGSIYLSVSDSSPASLFGGSWTQIRGRFLVGTGANEANTTDWWGPCAAGAINCQAGEMGGEHKHQLTASESPRFTGQLYSGAGNDGASAGGYGPFRSGSGVFSVSGVKQYGQPQTSAVFPSGSAYKNANIDFGGNGFHNNMPPYLAVYMWKRTA